MSFDPYHQWLDIPPNRQPPSAFVLLGLPDGELDPHRVHQSAAERYEHVRRYILGPHGAEAQRLLTEISRAVTELLNRRSANGAAPRRERPATRGEAVETLHARAVVERRPAKPWPTSFRDWLDNEGQPSDVFQLLGRLRFDPDRESMVAEIAAADAELARLQTQPDRRLADRARRIRKLLGYAKEILDEPQRLDAYLDLLIQRLEEAFQKARAAGDAPWPPDRILDWLEREQWVHPYALGALVRVLTGRPFRVP